MKLRRQKQIENIILCVLCIGLASLFTWNRFVIQKEVKRVKEPVYEQNVWNSLKSQDINEKGILIVSGEEPVEADLYMDENMQLFIEAGSVQDCFACSVHLYNNLLLKLQKKDTIVQFPINESCYYSGETKVENEGCLQQKGEKLYLPFDVLMSYFDCSYTWDPENYTLHLQDHWKDSVTPAYYNLQEQGRATIIKNQGTLGTCWAVAALSALETSLKPEEDLYFATDHMSIRNSFHISQNDGGEYTMSMAYLLGWQGPVLESDDPYGDKISPAGLSAVKHVQEIQLIKEKNIDKIKQAVFFHGAVQTSIYTSLRRENSRSSYYNKNEAAYCYIGDAQPNHEIIIIGWDDAYPKDKFNMEVEGDGAFICQNSWGEGFGHDGIFYVSYYDSQIGNQSVIYTKVENKNNYDHIYQTDLCGWAGQLGYDSDTAWFANAFTTESKERVCAAGFYATGPDTSYEIYFVPVFNDVLSLEKRIMVAVGELKEAGFYTIPFNNEQIVEEEQRFAVVIKITTPGSVHPVAVEYCADDATKNVDLTDGEGYISMYGNQWGNVETEQNCNVCMKIYTRDEE